MAKQAPAELADLPNVHFTAGCDVSKRQACTDFINSIPGRLDGLLNVAGITLTEGKIATDEVFQKVMAVNLTGTWNMGTEALKRMAEQEVRYSTGIFTGAKKEIGRGAIVNVSSGAGVRAVPGLAVYCASKHAVIGLTRVWAADFPLIRVNAVLPGTIWLAQIFRLVGADHQQEQRTRRSSKASLLSRKPSWRGGNQKAGSACLKILQMLSFSCSPMVRRGSQDNCYQPTEGLIEALTPR